MISQYHTLISLTREEVSNYLTADTTVKLETESSFQFNYHAVAEADRILCDKLDKGLQAGGISKHKRKREIVKLWDIRQNYLLSQSHLDKFAILAYYQFNYT